MLDFIAEIESTGDPEFPYAFTRPDGCRMSYVDLATAKEDASSYSPVCYVDGNMEDC